MHSGFDKPMQLKLTPREAQSRLEVLPAELRNYIYRLAVIDHQPLTISHEPIWLRSARQPAIARVKRNIRDAVLPIFYGENIFAAHVSKIPLYNQAVSTWAQANKVHLQKIRCLGAMMDLERPSISYAAIYAQLNKGVVGHYRLEGDVEGWEFCTCSLELIKRRVEDCECCGITETVTCNFHACGQGLQYTSFFNHKPLTRLKCPICKGRQT